MARASPPGAPGLDVESGVLRPARDVDAHVEAEPSGNEITETDAPRVHRVRIAEFLARAPGAPGAEEADQRPARIDLPAQLGLGDAGALVLVARGRDAAQVDVRKLVERDVAARGARIQTRAEHELPGEGEITVKVRVVGLVFVVAADVGRVEHGVDVALPAARGREDVVARVVLERDAKPRALHGERARLKRGKLAGGVEARIEVEIDPAPGDEVVALGEPVHDLLRRDESVQVVADAAVGGAGHAAGAEEIEVDVGEADAAAPAPAIVVEGDHAAGAAELGAVFSGGERNRVDVGRRDMPAVLAASGRLTDRLAAEEQRRAGAVPDRRLGDEDRHRQEAFAVEQPLGRVELAVLGILEGAALVLLLSEQLAAQAQGGNPGQPVCCSKKPHLAAAAPAAPTAAAARAAAAAETTAAAETAAALETAPRALLRGARLARLARVGLPVERVDRLAAAGPAAARGLLRRAIGAAGGLLRRPGARVGPVAAFGPIAADIRPGAAALAFAGAAFIFLPLPALVPIHVAVAAGVDIVAARALGERRIPDLRSRHVTSARSADVARLAAPAVVAVVDV